MPHCNIFLMVLIKGMFCSVKSVSCVTFRWIQTKFRSLSTISHDSHVFILFFRTKLLFRFSWTPPMWILEISILRRLWLCIVAHIFTAKGVGVIDQVAEAS